MRTDRGPSWWGLAHIKLGAAAAPGAGVVLRMSGTVVSKRAAVSNGVGWEAYVDSGTFQKLTWPSFVPNASTLYDLHVSRCLALQQRRWDRYGV